MEKAVLKTLSYADIFDYPLKAWEIHKWLVGRKVSLHQIEKVLRRKNLELRIKHQDGYYFLKNRKGLVKKRLERERQSKRLLRQASWVGEILKIIPSVKLVGISGNLSMENATRVDDIDFFIITKKGRLWISRLITLLILNLLGKRRQRGEKKVSGKVCVNILVEEDQLEQKNKDLYTAHEILQLRVLWQRQEVYTKFLEENNWAFKFLPNWTASVKVKSSNKKKDKNHQGYYSSSLIDGLEYLAKLLQLRYMGSPSGKERVSSGALYFHPRDYREEILKKYRFTLDKFS